MFYSVSLNFLVLGSSVCLMANNSWTNEEMNQHSTYSGNSRIPLKKPEMKNNTGIAMVWTPEEQTILDNALARYPLDSCVSSCLRTYAKISLELPEKTTRDIAMRCRWNKELRRVKVEDSISAPHDAVTSEFLFFLSNCLNRLMQISHHHHPQRS